MYTDLVCLVYTESNIFFDLKGLSHDWNCIKILYIPRYSYFYLPLCPLLFPLYSSVHSQPCICVCKKVRIHSHIRDVSIYLLICIYICIACQSVQFCTVSFGHNLTATSKLAYIHMVCKIAAIKYAVFLHFMNVPYGLSSINFSASF